MDGMPINPKIKLPESTLLQIKGWYWIYWLGCWKGETGLAWEAQKCGTWGIIYKQAYFKNINKSVQIYTNWKEERINPYMAVYPVQYVMLIPIMNIQPLNFKEQEE